MKYFGDNSLAKLIALIKDTLSAHTDDTSIHVTAAEKEAWENAGKPFVIEGTAVSVDSGAYYQIININKTRAEIKAAVQAGGQVILRPVEGTAHFDMPMVTSGLSDEYDIYYFSVFYGSLYLAQLYYMDDGYQGLLMIGDVPRLSDDAPSAPGTASAGTSDEAARADHVHPSERPKATLVTLSAASWDASTKKQTVDVAGIDADESKQVIYVMPYSADTQAYKDAGIQMSAQAAGKATFICESVPEGTVKVWVVVEDVEDVTPPPCLTFSSPSAFSVSVEEPGWDGTVEYSVDKATWTPWSGIEIDAKINGGIYVLYFRGTGNTKVTGNANVDGDTNSKWTLTGTNIACDGNIESLLDYATVAAGDHPAMANDCYAGMFKGCTSLVSAPALQATALVGDCYSYMFNGCTGLTAAPMLPATALAVRCYYDMFEGCTGLTVAPVLPATTLADYCYCNMFTGCTGLTVAPALPATALAERCYYFMFRDCTGLTTASELPATTLAEGCYCGMFEFCPSLAAAPELPATTLAKSCYSDMFHGCDSLTSAPALPATTMATYCYKSMFSGCDSLNSAPALPATTLANYCYCNMFYYCDALISVPALPATTLATGCYQSMFGHCTKLKMSATQTGNYTKAYRIPSSGTGTTADNAFSNMLANTGGTFTSDPAINTTYYLDASNSIV